MNRHLEKKLEELLISGASYDGVNAEDGFQAAVKELWPLVEEMKSIIMLGHDSACLYRLSMWRKNKCKCDCHYGKTREALRKIGEE